MDKKMKPVNTKAVELDDEALKQASGGTCLDKIPICCNISLGGCGKITYITVGVSKWTCSNPECKKVWRIDG